MSGPTRAHPRYAVEVDAIVRSGAETLPARTRDLSRGGLAFFAARPLDVGGSIDISLSLVFDAETFSEPLAVRARVVWCTPLGGGRFQVGAVFTGMTGDGRTYLDMFLRYLAEGQAADERSRPGADPDEEPFG